MLWTIIILVATLLLGTALISLLVFYTQFLRSPVKLWSDRVLGAVEAADRQQKLEQQRIHSLKEEHARAVAELKQRGFQSYLATFSVHELDDAPGIGPATVMSLDRAGFRNLAALQNAVIAIPGIGEKRLADIAAAIRNLTAKARETFDGGRCPQAIALPRQLQELELRRQAETACIEARLRAAESVGKELEVRAIEARRVTFWNHLRMRLRDQIPGEELGRPLPDLTRALEAADAEARRLFPAPPPMALPAPTPPGRRNERRRQRREPLPAPETIPPPAVAVEPSASSLPARLATQPPADRSQEMLELTVQLLMAAARSDGRLAERERQVIENHFCRRYEYNQALYNRARVLCAHYESATIDLDRCLARIAELFTVPHREALVREAYEVSAASGGVNERESGFLSKLCIRLNVRMPSEATPGESSAGADQTRQEPCSSAPSLNGEAQWLGVLEIERDVRWTAELVRRQYHLLLERYEPAKVHNMGPEFAAMAEQKRAAVRVAALGLLAKLGEPLEEAPRSPPSDDIRHNPDLDALFGG